ncbi:pathogenesis-related thaumatin-like protein 3.5 [Heracleum sosnowskyi]|uniref:Pathogenesis-related thaumatin-like protein 3.5 n=1 Tax=Heracleum sosnowskyi TaxID=360622 RepID=A0AAD8M6W7_9APIA|nr:pathogenesis-related thaumatin-like protein 3.5 [Heracleum sosnowskyi]
MERMASLQQVSFILVLFALGINISECARMFTLINDCKETIWPAITPGGNFGNGGFALKPTESRVFQAPIGWSGRIWGRTGCNFDKDGKGMCQTGRCGTSLHCTASGETPATLAEFTLATPDFYDVSLVDGFNLPMSIKPMNGQGNCSRAGCDGDLRPNCPKELAVKSGGSIIACRSACDVFNTDQYCCRGNYGNAATCTPTFYSKKFKAVCPASYSYAYDDPSSIFTCGGTQTDYIITYCSGRKQPVCTYHNDKLICSKGSGLKPLPGIWTVMILFISLISLRMLF